MWCSDVSTAHHRKRSKTKEQPYLAIGAQRHGITTEAGRTVWQTARGKVGVDILRMMSEEEKGFQLKPGGHRKAVHAGWKGSRGR